MKIMYAALIFLMVLGLMLGIYSSSSTTQFNLTGATTTYTTLNINVTSIQTNFANTANLTPNSSPSPCDVFCQIWNGLVSAVYSFCGNGCIIFGGATPLAQVLSLGQNGSATARNIQVANNFANGQAASNNKWLGNILGNPLDEALFIMSIFLGIGLFAGLLGAGLLARVVASVGIGISVIVFIEGQMGAFTALPLLISLPFNGILGILLLIIAWESFNTPGAAA